ncbi:hypothetical protein O181_023159 [Austropuccinia psidii MF-1]|uniref:Uncharacterized protein n=1 Tax=Austropuccinia psidii MF-1 TaxID=1389203 RepID=A0A9Q3GYD9_9BASI|nr:hypothetical protein [Austropuccinia psidii MF-1]
MSLPSSSLNRTLSQTHQTIFRKEYIHNISEIDKIQVKNGKILHNIALLQRQNDGHDEEISLLQGKLVVEDHIIQQLQAEVLEELNDMEAHLQSFLE